jgi:hypothetical protein
MKRNIKIEYNIFNVKLKDSIAWARDSSVGRAGDCRNLIKAISRSLVQIRFAGFFFSKNFKKQKKNTEKHFKSYFWFFETILIRFVLLFAQSNLDELHLKRLFWIFSKLPYIIELDLYNWELINTLKRLFLKTNDGFYKIKSLIWIVTVGFFYYYGNIYLIKMNIHD